MVSPESGSKLNGSKATFTWESSNEEIDCFALDIGTIEGASDVHIEPLETQVVIRYRVDGVLR